MEEEEEGEAEEYRGFPSSPWRRVLEVELEDKLVVQELAGAACRSRTRC
jgi:hypothetical protein